MNWSRIGLGMVVTVSAGCLLLLADRPVQASARVARPQAREELFAITREWALVPQQTLPKVDPRDEIPLPEGNGKDTTKRVCGNCHSTNVWIQQRHTTEKWGQIIDNMVSKGMEASDDDLATVNDYLGKYLAPAPKAAQSQNQGQDEP